MTLIVYKPKDFVGCYKGEEVKEFNCTKPLKTPR